MKQWYQQLSRSERRLITVAGFCTLMTVFYWLAWKPYVTATHEWSRRVVTLSQQLDWMLEQAPKLKPTDIALTDQAARGDVAEAISLSGRKWGISAQRIVPGGGGVEVFYTKPLSFESLMRWLETLEHDYAIQVIQIELDASSSGYVQVKRLRLGRPAT